MSSRPPTDTQNPWSDEPGQHQHQHSGYQNHDPYHAYEDQTRTQQPSSHPTQNMPPSTYQASASPHYQQDSPSYEYTSTTHNPESTLHEYQPPNHPPPSFVSSQQQQSPSYQPSSTYSTHNNTHNNTYNDDDNDDYNIPPSLPPRRTATDLALPTGQDRTHQIEVMQSYQAAGRKDEHDLNVELLQREFPKIDGSLIAAIYGDSLSLSATRELLGELE